MAAGQPAERFWRVTPREAQIVLRGAARLRETDAEMAAQIAWETARLVAVGVNNPKKFPDYVPLAERGRGRRRPEMTDEELFARLRATTLALGGTVHE